MTRTWSRLLDGLYLLPALAMLGLFVIYPLIANIILGFFEFTATGDQMDFVGLSNYTHLFDDPIIGTALLNNVLYAVVSIIFQVAGALVLAALVQHMIGPRLGTFLRSLYFIPSVISMTVVALLFTFIYEPQSGLLNSLLDAVGLSGWTHSWLGDTGTAMESVIAVSQWQSIGFVMMLFIVTLQGIPGELYEAASLDGAGKVRQFFSITLPQSREMIFVAMILTTTGAFTVFNEPYILTGGGPGNASQVLGTYMYQQGFFTDQMGYASAIATLIFLITLVLSLFQIFAFRTGKD